METAVAENCCQFKMDYLKRGKNAKSNQRIIILSKLFACDKNT